MGGVARLGQGLPEVNPQSGQENELTEAAKRAAAALLEMAAGLGALSGVAANADKAFKPNQGTVSVVNNEIPPEEPPKKEPGIDLRGQ